MVKIKRAAFIILLIFLTGSAAAIKLDLDVSAMSESTERDLTYSNSTALQNINATVENTGSVGCQYRLKTIHSYENGSITRFSQPAPIWPGSQEYLESEFVALNHTGEVDTSVYTTFCGQEKSIKNFTWMSEGPEPAGANVESTTLEADENGATVELAIENGTLVPDDIPPYWKVGSAELKHGKSNVTYEAPIYRPRNLTYTVVSNEGEVVGETSISLEPETSLMDKLEQRLPLIFAGLLSVSVILNLFQWRRRIIPRRLRTALSKLGGLAKSGLREFKKRDIKKN